MEDHKLGLVILLSFSVLLHSTNSLDILSFNIKQFGTSKYSKQNIVDILLQIVEGYDLILIIELVDASNKVISGFVDQLNQHVEGKGFNFHFTVSERVARSNNKEQYAFVYRTNMVEVINTFQYNDINDQFERPPYAILVQEIRGGLVSLLPPRPTDVPPFFIIASHTKPNDAVNEIDGLLNVFNSAAKYFSTDAGMIVGDLNADCSYVSNAQYISLDLILNTSFTWWIDKDANTTTGASNCAYDRIITSSSLTPFVVNTSIEVVRFDELYSVSADLIPQVSDHYPVTVTIQDNSHGGTAASTYISIHTFLILILILLTLFGTLDYKAALIIFIVFQDIITDAGGW